jgi:hypothetical protein
VGNPNLNPAPSLAPVRLAGRNDQSGTPGIKSKSKIRIRNMIRSKSRIKIRISGASPHPQFKHA